MVQQHLEIDLTPTESVALNHLKLTTLCKWASVFGPDNLHKNLESLRQTRKQNDSNKESKDSRP